ncbi:prolyl oligopeptidase family serine peptidase [Polaribacter vadi]|uniref:alpha/beta hydrolase family protein n=1 Tax=Polaribacter TaxID=52959 RepID=UPI001C0A3026|nr:MULTISPECIES: prolyl oligopeptidase family serine peptidase [Polaribacter]MBU3012712.1 prolyl oligopeptidase family serine peptidase [Polaribacter vadi]MDO6742528.1 prolyl oligopeptidase family serine peptidase [Polaribacter sp. 1_MG-2023]
MKILSWHQLQKNNIRKFTLLLIQLLIVTFAQAQNGKIINKEKLILSDATLNKIKKADSTLITSLKNIEFYKITYLSDSLEIKGFIAKPVQKGNFPCIISNRGGTGNFGNWNETGIGFFLGKLASWGYVVVASQYRGNGGSQGKEEAGGKDINDVLNLLPTLNEIDNADTSRIGIEGASRGGMMTYLALKKTCEFKAAVVLAGAANSFKQLESRPEMEEHVFAKYIPNYQQNKEEELKARSAVFWADKICKTTPLLLMHGSADWRVKASESLELVNKLYEYKHPVRFMLFEGAEHGLREFRNQYFTQTKSFFDYYLKNNNDLPNMELHGR